MQDDVKRRSGPFQGNGQTTDFPFGFYVFSNNDVRVETSDTDSVVTTVLVKDVDYTVTINADQNATAGGTVKLAKALPAGKSLAITSNLAYTQEMQLTNFSRFPPEILNDAMDRTVILIQQLKEMAERHLTVPATSEKTPQQVMSEILEIAATANQYAGEAHQILIDTGLVRDEVASYAKTAQALEPYKDKVQTVYNNLSKIESILADIASITTVASNVSSVKTAASNTSNINAVVSNQANINVVASEQSNIQKVSANSSNISAVASNQSNINSVASNATNINTVSANIGSVQEVSRISPSVVTVANSTGQLNNVLDYVGSIQTVGGAIEAIREVAGDIDSETWDDTEDYGNVGDAITSRKPVGGNIVVVANDISSVKTVAQNITNVNAVGTNTTNINKVASLEGKVNTVANDLPVVIENLDAINAAPSYAQRAEEAAKRAESGAEAVGDPISKTEATNAFVGKASFADEFNALEGTFDYGDLS